MDTLHICTSSGRDDSKEYLDASLITYWTVIKDGKIYDEIQDKAMAPSEPLKFTPKQPGKYAIEVYADDHPQEPKRNDDRTSTITAAITACKVEIEDVAPRDTDDLQVQHFKREDGTFTYTAIPYQIYYTIKPDTGWTPDSVQLKIKDSSGVIRTKTLSTGIGQQETTWDGKNDSGDYPEYGLNTYKAEIVVTKGSTTCSAEKIFSIFEVRQANCVYRPLARPGARFLEHAAVLYEYTGGNSLADLQNGNKYTVMEAPGVCQETGVSNYGAYTWLGAFCPDELKGPGRRTKRKAILAKCYQLDQADIHYVRWSRFPQALIHNRKRTSPGGTDWGGCIGDIARIRCDGVSEVAYEDTGVRLYGGDDWWNIMVPGARMRSNLNKHNNGFESMTPGKQMSSALTKNVGDARYLP